MFGIALQKWSQSVRDVYSVLLQSPENWSPDVWNLIKGFNAALTIVAVSLLSLFFMYSFVRKGERLHELKMEVVASMVIKLIIGNFLVTNSLKIMTQIIFIVQGCIAKIGGRSIYANVSIPKQIDKAIDSAGIITGLTVFLIGMLLTIIVYVCTIVLSCIVWGRFIKIYIYLAVSGIFLSTFAAEETRGVGIAFVKSFLGVLLSGLIMIVVLLIYSNLIKSSSPSMVGNIREGEEFSMIMEYSKHTLIGLIITVSTCKSADHLVQRMGL